MIETERLYARPWSVDDAEGAFAMYGDPEVVRHIGSEVLPDVAAQRERLAAIIERNARWGSRYGSWPVFERASGELCGTVITKPLLVSGTGGEFGPDIEIGWHLNRRFWGRGYAVEAARAVVARAFGELGLEIVHAVVESPNVRSLNVARRLGMRHTGRTARYYDLELEHFELRRGEYLHSLGSSA